MSGRQHRGLDDAIEALAAVEAHVVADAHMVDLVLGHTLEERRDATEVTGEHITRDTHPDPHVGSAVPGNPRAHETKASGA